MSGLIVVRSNDNVVSDFMNSHAASSASFLEALYPKTADFASIAA